MINPPEVILFVSRSASLCLTHPTAARSHRTCLLDSGENNENLMKQLRFRHQNLLFRQKQSHQRVCLPQVSLEQPYNSPSTILPVAHWLLLIKDSPIHIEAILI